MGSWWILLWNLFWAAIIAACWFNIGRDYERKQNDRR